MAVYRNQRKKYLKNIPSNREIVLFSQLTRQQQKLSNSVLVRVEAGLSREYAVLNSWEFFRYFYNKPKVKKETKAIMTEEGFKLERSKNKNGTAILYFRVRSSDDVDRLTDAIEKSYMVHLLIKCISKTRGKDDFLYLTMEKDRLSTLKWQLADMNRMDDKKMKYYNASKQDPGTITDCQARGLGRVD